MKAEGVVGIARAFIASGARLVLVSLWAVDDKATKDHEVDERIWDDEVHGEGMGPIRSDWR